MGYPISGFQDRHVRPLRHPSKPTLLVLDEYHARSTTEHPVLFTPLRDRAVYGVPVGLVNTHSRSHVHWASIAQRDPAANDAIHEPQSDQTDRKPHEEEADPQGRDDEGSAEGDPEQSKPEGSDLPAKVRFKPGAASLTPLDVVQDDRDDRRPAGEEGADHRGRTNDAGQQAERVQGVYDLGPGDQ